jgi:hypothetical protein
VSEADSADNREVAGEPDNAFAHMLGGRDPLEVRCKVHTLVLVVEVGALRDDKSILDRIVERREFMNIDVIGLLTPTDRRSRPQRTLPVAFA